MSRFRKQSDTSLFFKLPWSVLDSELFAMAPDIDTYVYLVFLRMSVGFFLVLAIFNTIALMPIYYTGTAQAHLYETIMPQIQ